MEPPRKEHYTAVKKNEEAPQELTSKVYLVKSQSAAGRIQYAVPPVNERDNTTCIWFTLKRLRGGTQRLLVRSAVGWDNKRGGGDFISFWVNGFGAHVILIPQQNKNTSCKRQKQNPGKT